MTGYTYLVDFSEIDDSKGATETAPGQANVARLRDQAAMVNESHALDAPQNFTRLRPSRRKRQTKKIQNSSISLTIRVMHP